MCLFVCVCVCVCVSPVTAFCLLLLLQYMVKIPDYVRIVRAGGRSEMVSRQSDQGRRELERRLAHPETVDEVADYEMARFLSASEAIHRTLGFAVHGCDPVVEVFGCHLPNQRDALYGDNGAVVEHVDWEAAGSHGTRDPHFRVERYLHRPAGPEFDDLTLLQYYERYEVKRTGRPPARISVQPDGHGWRPPARASVDTPREWTPANVWRRKERVCRLYGVSFRRPELYALRLLLQHVPARSFEGLRRHPTHPDRLATTFGQACVWRGLLRDGAAVIAAVDEAVALQATPDQLRRLVGTVVEDAASCPSGTIEELLQRFGAHMVADIYPAALMPVEGGEDDGDGGGDGGTGGLGYEPVVWEELPEWVRVYLRFWLQRFWDDRGVRADDVGMTVPNPSESRLAVIHQQIAAAAAARDRKATPVGVGPGYWTEYYTVTGHALAGEGGTGGAGTGHGSCGRESQLAAARRLDTARQDDLRDQVRRGVSQLNEDQRLVYDTVLESVRGRLRDQQPRTSGASVAAPTTSAAFFLDAPAGTGKTFTINLILATIKSDPDLQGSDGQHPVTVATAFTGIGAKNLIDGATLHSTAKLPLDVETDADVQVARLTSERREYLAQAAIVVVDEYVHVHVCV